VVLYATGLGPTAPAAVPNRLPEGLAPLAQRGEFEVWLNGARTDPGRLLYAGATPGYAGLFQINLRLPEDAPQNPYIRIGRPGQMSPEGITLPLH
jgi:uncharacterized protein (TIGR03437 family)